jgi:hypothetical protein
MVTSSILLFESPKYVEMKPLLEDEDVTLSRGVSSTSLVMELQPKKALLPILVTEAGIVTDTKLEQSSKA